MSNDPVRQRLLELFDQLIEIKDQTRQIQATWKSFWEDPHTEEDVAYLGTLINQLAEQFGLNEEVQNDDPETRN
jgi:hypothetical protein